ncbi:hypothetical protein BGX38DRAFT_1264761 [Terfezia claveryi]|nr:hypothetical protein BGX38DRAFT_1264761 [Terfezia claveryi]
MPFLRSTHTTTAKPSLMSRIMGRSPRTHTTRTTPVHHHKRRPSIGDRISSAMLKLKGSLTNRPGQKTERAQDTREDAMPAPLQPQGGEGGFIRRITRVN